MDAWTTDADYRLSWRYTQALAYKTLYENSHQHKVLSNGSSIAQQLSFETVSVARDLVLSRGRMDLQLRQQNNRRLADLKDSYSVPKSIFDSNSIRETNKNNGNSNDDGESTGSNLDSLLFLSEGITYDTACQTSASPPHDFDVRLESETCGGTGPNHIGPGFLSPSATTDTRRIKSEVAFDLFAFAAYECDFNARKQNRKDVTALVPPNKKSSPPVCAL